MPHLQHQQRLAGDKEVKTACTPSRWHESVVSKQLHAAYMARLPADTADHHTSCAIVLLSILPVCASSVFNACQWADLKSNKGMQTSTAICQMYKLLTNTTTLEPVIPDANTACSLTKADQVLWQLHADDATSPPPVGLPAFARKAAREPFAALQLHAKQPRGAAPPLQPWGKESQGSAGLKRGSSSSLLTLDSLLPVAATKQARSK